LVQFFFVHETSVFTPGDVVGRASIT
jgi:hypothetical protein